MIAMASLFVACGQKTNETSAEASTEAVAEATPAETEVADECAPATYDQMPDMPDQVLDMVKTYPKSREVVYNSLIDMNGDGNNEILVRIYTPATKNYLYDVYTFDSKFNHYKMRLNCNNSAIIKNDYIVYEQDALLLSEGQKSVTVYTCISKPSIMRKTVMESGDTNYTSDLNDMSASDIEALVATIDAEQGNACKGIKEWKSVER